MLTLADVELSLSNEAKAPTSTRPGACSSSSTAPGSRPSTSTPPITASNAAARAIKIVDGEPALENEKDRGLDHEPAHRPLFLGPDGG